MHDAARCIMILSSVRMLRARTRGQENATSPPVAAYRPCLTSITELLANQATIGDIVDDYGALRLVVWARPELKLVIGTEVKPFCQHHVPKYGEDVDLHVALWAGAVQREVAVCHGERHEVACSGPFVLFLILHGAAYGAME